MARQNSQKQAPSGGAANPGFEPESGDQINVTRTESRESSSGIVKIKSNPEIIDIDTKDPGIITILLIIRPLRLKFASIYCQRWSDNFDSALGSFD